MQCCNVAMLQCNVEMHYTALMSWMTSVMQHCFQKQIYLVCSKRCRPYFSKHSTSLHNASFENTSKHCTVEHCKTIYLKRPVKSTAHQQNDVQCLDCFLSFFFLHCTVKLCRSLQVTARSTLQWAALHCYCCEWLHSCSSIFKSKYN